MVQRRSSTGGQNRPRGPRKQHTPEPSPSNADVAAQVQADLQAQYGMTRAIDYAHGRAAQAEAARTMPPEEATAILRARAGDDTELFPYTPTPSINPPRPRTIAAGYSKDTQTLRIKFREGAVYEYYDVPENVWRNFKRVKSPGRAVNRVLNNYPYSRRHDLEV